MCKCDTYDLCIVIRHGIYGNNRQTPQIYTDLVAMNFYSEN